MIFTPYLFALKVSTLYYATRPLVYIINGNGLIAYHISQREIYFYLFPLRYLTLKDSKRNCMPQSINLISLLDIGCSIQKETMNYEGKICKGSAISIPHYFLSNPNAGIKQKYAENLGYCPICWHSIPSSSYSYLGSPSYKNQAGVPTPEKDTLWKLRNDMANKDESLMVLGGYTHDWIYNPYCYSRYNCSLCYLNSIPGYWNWIKTNNLISVSGSNKATLILCMVL